MAVTALRSFRDRPARRHRTHELALSSAPYRRVAILGFGTVGSAVADLLCRNLHPQLQLTYVFSRDVHRKRVSWVPSNVCWTESVEDVFAGDVDVVVELMGGIDPAREWVRRALVSGKSVVTANKYLIAVHGDELLRLAHETGQMLEFGASVGGGVPMISGLQRGLAGDQIIRLTGELNGTCNYILSKMESDNQNFACALAKAQELGYAEANPACDVDGFDASCKLAILSRLAFKAAINPDQIYRRSIQNIAAVDFRHARRMGRTIRQISLAEIREKHLYATVQPAMVPVSSPLGQTIENQNALIATGTSGGETVFAGRGAGGGPTAVAVVSDLIALAEASSAKATIFPGPKPYFINGDLEFPRYLRLRLRNHADFETAVQVLSAYGISPTSLMRRPSRSAPMSILLLRPCLTSAVDAAIERLQELGMLSEDAVALPLVG